MAYNRTRSRNHADDFIVLQKGTIPSTTNLVNASANCIMDRVNGSLDTSLNFDGFVVPLAGLTVYTNGTRKYYSISDVQNRIKSYAPQLIAHYSEALNTARSAYLQSSPPFLRMKGGDTMSDVVTPEYKRLSRAGFIVNTPMTRLTSFAHSHPDNSGTFQEPSMANQHFDSGGSPWNNTMVYAFKFSIRQGVAAFANGIPRSVFDTFVSQFSHELLDIEVPVNKAFQKCYDAEADVALALAEANKTISHLALTASRIAKLAKAIKSGQFVNLAPKAFAKWKKDGPIATSSSIFMDAWLEARYAWRPLIMDIQAINKYLNKPSATTPRRTFRAFENVDDDQEIDQTISSDGYSCRFVGTLSSSRSVRAGCLTEIDLGLAAYRDLGFLNPAGLVWELIPYSFVVDWFVNVKGILSHLNPDSGIKILSSWATQLSEINFIGNVTVTDLSNSVQKSIPFRYSTGLKVRNVDVSPSFINLDINLDVYKLVDAVALLRRFKH